MKPFDADLITLDNFKEVFACRKKPIIVHAVQIHFPEGFTVTTKEGKDMSGKPGDYLMFGIDGEKYICDEDIFRRTYDRIGEED